MPTYVFTPTKSIVVDAVEFDGTLESLKPLNIKEIGRYSIRSKDGKPYLLVITTEGEKRCNVGDYLVKGKSGYYVVDANTFPSYFDKIG